MLSVQAVNHSPGLSEPAFGSLNDGFRPSNLHPTTSAMGALLPVASAKRPKRSSVASFEGYLPAWRLAPGAWRLEPGAWSLEPHCLSARTDERRML